MQLDLFTPVPDDFWDGGTLSMPSDVELRRIEQSICTAEALFKRSGHNRNHAAYRLLVRLRKQRASLRAANDI